MPKKIISGIVVSDKNAKTRVVEIRSKYRDPRYGKFVRHRTKCYVHDEKNESRTRPEQNGCPELVPRAWPVSYAGRRNGPKLRGGFGRAITAALTPNVKIPKTKYLGQVAAR